uniref:Transposase n=3 Tax=Candidatus Kentrum sp. SD TaxID=2126332 RepID=A0A450YKG2_9GAMM|nr:MAG: hypothetical protein BECKSD772F_GA0070984_111111 [Candidatus Kentron sp. SD]
MERGRKHTAQFKEKVALEAVKGHKTSGQLSSEFQVHPTVINRWKKQLLDSLPEVFQQGKKSPRTAEEALTGSLYQEIGRLKMELDWLKKKLPFSIEGRRGMVKVNQPHFSIVRQCRLVGLSRSSYYHRPAVETEENLRYMRLIDEQYMLTPFFGSRQMTRWLNIMPLRGNWWHHWGLR